MTDPDLPIVSFVFQIADLEASVVSLAPHFFKCGSLSISDLRISAITEGTTNALYKISVKQPERLPHSQAHKVLVKIYGAGTDLTIDRDQEIDVHKTLSDNNLAPRLLCRFDNGHAYEFLDGAVCSGQDIGKSHIWRGVARALAEWHAISPSFACNSSTNHNLTGKRELWSKAETWLRSLPYATEAQSTKKRALQDEYKYLRSKLGESNLHDVVVLGHGDLLYGNIIIQGTASDKVDEVASVKFIDYEHSVMCPRAFELANHFSEWAGFECDYSLLPTTSVRNEFIREYLEAYHHTMRQEDPSDSSSSPVQVSEAEVLKLSADVDAYRGVPGFYWGLCALIQDHASTGEIDFNYVEYADKRLAEYWAWRHTQSSTSPKDALEQTREEKWFLP